MLSMIDTEADAALNNTIRRYVPTLSMKTAVCHLCEIVVIDEHILVALFSVDDARSSSFSTSSLTAVMMRTALKHKNRHSDKYSIFQVILSSSKRSITTRNLKLIIGVSLASH